jgi:uncharacterized protein with von Willebrand factor type A (vWA) domain
VAAQWRSAGDDEPEDDEETSIRIVASGVEVLREKSFPDLTEEERARVAAMIRRLAVTVPVERTRRTKPASKGSTFDIRRTLRRSLRTQGEPFERAMRARKSRTRPLVLILDISGSMAPYARALMQFGYAAMSAGRRVEVFVFGTRLTRVTRTLRTKDPDARCTRSARRSPTGRRDPDRRVPEDVARRVESASGAPRRRRRAVLRRPGAR